MIGRGAAFQLVWTLQAQKDSVRAITLAETLANATGSSPMERFQARRAVGIVQMPTGDKVRARQTFEALLHELGDRPECAELAQEMRQRLANP